MSNQNKKPDFDPNDLGIFPPPMQPPPFSLAKREKCPGFLTGGSEILHSMGRWCGAPDCRNVPKSSRHPKCTVAGEHGPHTLNSEGEELSGDVKRSEWCGGGKTNPEYDIITEPRLETIMAITDPEPEGGHALGADRRQKAERTNGKLDQRGPSISEQESWRDPHYHDRCNKEHPPGWCGASDCINYGEPSGAPEPEGGQEPGAESALLEVKEIQNTLYLLKTGRLPQRLMSVQLKRFGDELVVMRHENENWDRKWAAQLRGELNGKLLEKAPPELLMFVNAMLAKREAARARWPHRPQDPWNKYEPAYLQARLLDEVGEWLKETEFTRSGKPGEFTADPKKEAGELIDMANFVWFRWLQASGTVKGPPPVLLPLSCLKCGRNLEHGEVAHVEHGQLRCPNCLGAP